MSHPSKVPDWALDVLVAGIKANAAMAETGEASCTSTCPSCGGNLRFWLAGPKGHLRGKCAAKNCQVELME